MKLQNIYLNRSSKSHGGNIEAILIVLWCLLVTICLVWRNIAEVYIPVIQKDMKLLRRLSCLPSRGVYWPRLNNPTGHKLEKWYHRTFRYSVHCSCVYFRDRLFRDLPLICSVCSGKYSHSARSWVMSSRTRSRKPISSPHS
jgi:hypothetical protein